MKKLLIVYLVLTSIFLVYVVYYQQTKTHDSLIAQTNHFPKGELNESYVMVSFQSGIEYWKNALKGFEDSAQLLNVSVEYHGATKRDVNEQVTVLEHVIAKKPSGIALSAINPEALHTVIDKAYSVGIPIVLFDSGVPYSKALSYIGTNNYQAGVIAAHEMARLIGQLGQVAVMSMPDQLNMKQRYAGFSDTMKASYPKIEIVKLADGQGDTWQAQIITNQLLEDYPELKGIFVTEAVAGVGVGNAIKKMDKVKQIKIISFDTDRGTLDLINEGTIASTLAQNTWSMGYWSLQFLFHLQHASTQFGMTWNQDDTTSLIPAQLDTGISLVTRENVHLYYPK